MRYKNMRYKVTRVSGGGAEDDEGTWIIKKTPKTMIAEKIGAGNTIYENYEVGTRKKIGKGTGNPIRDEDGMGFTVYFEQSGTPYIFEPITA